MSKKSLLLLVDDDEMNRDMLGRRLVRAGFDVLPVASGEAALEAIERTPVDLVLLDVMMPGMSGLEVLTRLRSDPAKARLPIILVTARAMNEDLAAGLRAGADDYVTKPIDFPWALARIRTHLARGAGAGGHANGERPAVPGVNGTTDGGAGRGFATPPD